MGRPPRIPKLITTKKDPVVDAMLRYARRHEGRQAPVDAMAGLRFAAPAAIEDWLTRTVIGAARTALKGQPLGEWSPPPTWLRMAVAFHLMFIRQWRAEGTLPLRQEPAYFWDEDLLVQLLAVPPAPFVRALLESHRELVVTLRDQGQPFRKITGRLRDDALALIGVDARQLSGSPANEPEGFGADLLELARQVSGGLAAIDVRRPAHRPPDRALRGFFDGISWLFEQATLGKPSVQDLTDLAIVSGFERSDPKELRQRWRQRRRVYQEG